MVAQLAGKLPRAAAKRAKLAKHRAQNPVFRSASLRAAIDRRTTEGEEQSWLSRRNTRCVLIQSQLPKENLFRRQETQGVPAPRSTPRAVQITPGYLGFTTRSFCPLLAKGERAPWTRTTAGLRPRGDGHGP
jgi:hypothetical protein